MVDLDARGFDLDYTAKQLIRLGLKDHLDHLGNSYLSSDPLHTYL
jgi:hypothetical protein